MRLFCLLSTTLLLSVAAGAPFSQNPWGVYRKQTKDMSGRAGDPPEKYFHESTFHSHYDGRFAEAELGYYQQKEALKNLIETFLSTFRDIGVETWLAHGSLLGWWWNKHILPWDSDIDVQVTETGIWFLATYYNMSVFHYKTPRIPEGRDYMLEVNPHFVNPSQEDSLNKIDARWIDTISGLFIDITAARYNLTHPDGEGMMSCKDGHEFRDTSIFPLRDTIFEGMAAKIPHGYEELLLKEYGKSALYRTHFNKHEFREETMEWVPDPRVFTPPRFFLSEPGRIDISEYIEKVLHHPV